MFQRCSNVSLFVVALAGAACTSLPQPAPSTGSVVQVIHLQHVDAVGASQQLQQDKFEANIVPDPRVNAVVVVGDVEQVERVRRAVAALDQPS